MKLPNTHTQNKNNNNNKGALLLALLAGVCWLFVLRKGKIDFRGCFWKVKNALGLPTTNAQEKEEQEEEEHKQTNKQTNPERKNERGC